MLYVYNPFIIHLSFLAVVTEIPPALGPGVYSASNRNEDWKHEKNNVSG
jgi:hypothetical protein